MDAKKDTQLTKIETDFLISEFEKSWDMIFLLDERRVKIIQFYSVVFAAIIGFTANLIISNDDAFAYLAGAIISFVGILIGISSIMFLASERKANIRYRKKLNLIRGLFLEDSQSSIIKEYLSHKDDLGIKTISDPDQPKGWGKTLKNVVIIVYFEICFLLLACIYLLVESIRILS